MAKKSKENNQPMKKKLKKALIIIFSSLLVLYIIVSIIPLLKKEEAYDEFNVVADFDFYPADYSENIFTDENYMDIIKDKNRILRYDDGFSIYTIDFTDFENSNEPYAVVAKMLYSVIEGDHEEYNSYFSDRYFESQPKKEKFTPQKIYNATIKPISTETITPKNEKSYVEYTFEVKYYIYKNNGTFRKDIGDNARKQYIYVTNRTGKLLIDGIGYERAKPAS